jgi:carboxymethylenebutenolidase
VNETLTLSTPDGDMGIHIVRPDGDGPFPVIVFFHHGPGLDDASKATMQMLAERGYYVVSHDRYHRESPWFVMTPEMRQDQEAAQRFFAVLIGTSDDMVDADLNALLAHVDGDSAARGGATACIGYCIGARSVVVTMARHTERFAAGVGMHPSYCTTDQPDSPHLLVPSITGSLYVAFGSEDRMQSAADNVPFIDAVRGMSAGRGEADILDGANHGFAVVGGAAYHEDAAKVAYEKAFALFDQIR